jgi:hypothetical protein
VTARFRRILNGAPDELVPLAPDETSIIVEREMPEAVHRGLAALVADRPDVGLSLRAGEDLEMLRWYPGLRRLNGTSLRLRSLDGLRHVAGTLEWLSVGDTLRRLSLRPVEQAHGLRRLGVSGTWKDLDAIGVLTGLERLAIGSVDLEILRPLATLRRFESGLGTVRSLELLPEIGRLELVELYRLRGEHDLRPLGEVETLRYLMLESTRSVTILPSFARCPELRWVVLDEMRGITDLRPIADAPNLEVLMLIGMRQLDAESLRPLVGHPTLRAGVWGLSSDRKNIAAQDLLPLPPEPWNYPADRRRDPPNAPLPWDRPDWDGVVHPLRS